MRGGVPSLPLCPSRCTPLPLPICRERLCRERLRRRRASVHNAKPRRSCGVPTRRTLATSLDSKDAGGTNTKHAASELRDQFHAALMR
jgi:hypothetical protein